MFALDQFKIKTIAEDNHEGKFEISPLPRGYGQTLGNIIRRVLLSSIPGSAVTAIKFKNVEHEYSTLAEVQDDVLGIILNFKSMPVHLKGEEPVRVAVKAKGEKGKAVAVTAANVERSSNLQIIDEGHHITFLTGDTDLDLEIIVEKGVGFVPADQERRVEMGLIPVDANFSPVKNVVMEVSQTRVGQQTDLDKIVLSIFTNGAVKPSVVLHQAAQVVSQLTSTLMASATDVLTGEAEGLVGVKTEDRKVEQVSRKDLTIEDLGLSNRLTNALLRAGYTDLNELAGMSSDEIAGIKGMGAKSLSELLESLDKYKVEYIK